MQANLGGKDIKRIPLRVPTNGQDEIYERLVASAKANKRSINAEILAVLDEKLPPVNTGAQNR